MEEGCSLYDLDRYLFAERKKTDASTLHLIGTRHGASRGLAHAPWKRRRPDQPVPAPRDKGTRLGRQLGFSARKPGGAQYQRPLWLLSSQLSGGRRVRRSVEQFQ